MTGDELDIFVEADGGLEFIHDDDLVEMLDGDVQLSETRRASNVEPCGGGWTAAMVDGPVLWADGESETYLEGAQAGRLPFRTRKAALAAEVEWLTAAMDAAPCRTR